MLTVRTSRALSLAAVKFFIRKMADTFSQLLSTEILAKCERYTMYSVHEDRIEFAAHY
jgi:hypothetical protein